MMPADALEPGACCPPPACCSNLAVGGGWPGPPSATTPFPAVLKVDSVRVWGKQ